MSQPTSEPQRMSFEDFRNALDILDDVFDPTVLCLIVLAIFAIVEKVYA